ncbi:LTA synthase family protein [Acetobacter sacchari]|uniref:LTA synthase family protein n=1 Tax=Acetobacter sacchari TaxID=2661687 RepID=A0ABS3LXL0_9PROT|nr:LTA synthase family protein [Acetobacter sacchari]MBO1360633.1 LTA synthase family protein [Acetobacter sacchari]
MLLILTLVIVLIIALCADAATLPRTGKTLFPQSIVEFFIRALPILLLLGVILTLTGRVIFGAIITCAILGLLTLGSNLKRSVLGEALLFSDAAVIRIFFLHPRFYINAISIPGRIALLTGISFVTTTLIALLISDVATLAAGRGSARFLIRINGGILTLLTWTALLLFGATSLPRTLLPEADIDFGIRRYGLLATFALSWLRWRDDSVRVLPAFISLDTVNSQPPETRQPIVVVIQCESFSDPRDLNLPELTAPDLPNLTKSKAAGSVGNLLVSGFGAYTMRSEYGVLFGHQEAELGFRRFDPYLSAHRQGAHALPNRLANRYASRIFVHPYDLRFYGRDRLMPNIGFTDIVGGDDFYGDEKSGPHISDLALGRHLIKKIEIAKCENKATFIFAVSIENHGPWKGGLKDYLAHLRHGDELLGMISDALHVSGHPAILAFYGDHRPSIPKVVTPCASRHTPIILEHFGTSEHFSFHFPKNITPADLHHIIVDGCNTLTTKIK